MNIVTADEMYGIDQYTMETIGLDGKLLMENAGRAVSKKITEVVKQDDKIMIVIGPGNNGGDGFVIARTLMEENFDIKVVQVVPDHKITGDANYHKQIFLKCGGKICKVDRKATFTTFLEGTDVVVDCILGIGVKGQLREPIAQYVNQINKCSAMVISVDVPSGLPADEGVSSFLSIQADYTFVIGAAKMSAFLQSTAQFYGKWETVSIGFPKIAMEKFSKRKWWNESCFKETMPERGKFSYKGKHGRGMVIGGSLEMPGSITMTVQAALKAGAGLITAGTIKENIPIITSRCPEAMCTPLPENNGFIIEEGNIFKVDYDGIALGIGMGRLQETSKLVQRIVKKAKCPLIIDADGLYHVKKSLTTLKERKAPTILTPHVGEMAMLLDVSTNELLSSPFQYSLAFAKEYGVYVVLKGKYTIITAPDGKQNVNTTGNQGLAKGGSGDVLTGIVLASVMQHDEIFSAVCNACYLHGKAADIQVAEGNSYYDLMATDVISGISKVYRTHF